MLLALSFAFAGAADDMLTAADTDLPMETRQQAFGRLGSAETGVIVGMIGDSNTSPDQRWVLIRSLGVNTTPTAREALLKLADDKNPITRMAAVSALGDRTDGDLAARVATKLTDPGVLVRATAAEALGKLKDPKTLPDLERALQDPTNRYRGTSLWVRRKFVEAMAAIGTDAAVSSLAGALEDDDVEVVKAAVTGLEAVAGFSYKEGRSAEEELAAWRRWSSSR